MIYDYKEVKKSFLNDVTAIVQMEEIPPKFLSNWFKDSITLVMDNGQGRQVNEFEVVWQFSGGFSSNTYHIQRQNQSLSSPLSVFSGLTSYSL